jgi:hypothetical protein
MKNLFSILALTATVVFLCSLVGCGETTNVVNNYYTTDAGATVVNNTTNNYPAATPDGGSTTTVNVTNNYYGTEPDGGTTININVSLPSPAPIDGGTVSTPVPTPAKADIAMVAMKGGEKMLDGANGVFAWVAADGALVKFNTSTGTLTELNTPQMGSSDSFRYFDRVLALAVDVSGSVFWIYRHDYSQDSKPFAKVVVQRDKDTGTPMDSRIIDVSSGYPLAASIATSGQALGYVGAILPMDDYNSYTFAWFDLANGGTYAKGATATAPYDQTAALSGLRIHGGTAGFKMRDEYITVNLTGTGNATDTSEIYSLAVDFSGTSLIVLRAYMGEYWVNKNDSSNPMIGSQYEHGRLSNLTCTRCVALASMGNVAAWSVNGGLHYQVADNEPQFIPGVNEFVLGVTGMKLYYIGFDNAGEQWLYSRDLY